VDGENFRYSLKQLFQDKFKYLPKFSDWHQIFTIPKSSNQELVRIYWYVVEDLNFRPYELPREDRKFEKLLKKAINTKLELNRNEERKSSFLKEKRSRIVKRRAEIKRRFDEWKRIQNHISHSNNFLEFRRSGILCFNLLTNKFEKEKGVDVKLATDLIAFKEISDQVILFSGDQDYIPAIQVYKDAGKQIYSVNFETESGRILPGGSFNLEGLVDKVITIKYKQIESLIK